MMERPLVLSPAQARAVIEGRKTQHRVLIKPQPRMGILPDSAAAPGCPQEYGLLHPGRGDEITTRDCIHGQVGDRLWVREQCLVCIPPAGTKHVRVVLYKADGYGQKIDIEGFNQWRCFEYSSGFMPKAQARIWLEVTGLRIEALQNITAQDASAEGLKALSKDGGRTVKYGWPDRDGLPGRDDLGWDWRDWNVDPRVVFRDGWDRKHGGTANAWAANPWVWVLEFRMVQP